MDQGLEYWLGQNFIDEDLYVRSWNIEIVLFQERPMFPHVDVGMMKANVWKNIYEMHGQPV